MTKLVEFTDRAPELYVMEHAFSGPREGDGKCIGRAEEYFGVTLNRVEVGPPAGTDSNRGAYEWWPLILAGEKIGELRDDACGLTIHVRYKAKHPANSSLARKLAKAGDVVAA